jgi:RNA polymerase sigma-54 factor
MLRLMPQQVQRQEMHLTPMQVQYLKLLQLPVLALEQRIKDELELNPLLEEGAEMDQELDADGELEQIQQQDDLLPATLETDGGDGIERGGEAEDGVMQFEVATVRTEERDDTLDREIREHAEDENRWDDYIDNNEGAVGVTWYDHEDDREMPTPASVSMRDRLADQLRFLPLNETERRFGEIVLGEIDDDGYLRRSIPELLEELRDATAEDAESDGGTALQLSVETAELVLHRIQHLDPPGIAARTLRECLLVQLELLPVTSLEHITAGRILRECYGHFEKKHYQKILHELHISEDQLRRALQLIQTLNPKPGESERATELNYIIPDFTVRRVDDDFVIDLLDVPSVRVSRAYREMMKERRLGPDERKFLREKHESARWFIQAIMQRRQTMMKVMTAIIERQRAWFEMGDGHLRPMIYKDIADIIHMDISTISRVVNGKYVQTEWGVHELRYFFSEGIPTASGDEVSNKEVKRIIGDIIVAEDARKPLSDDAIMVILRQRGFDIARRTVAKYREAMGLPVARMRKRII